jgi:peroxiredoxin/uncharacterized membrane protein YphA (DoxX/SURF4 family)
MTGAGLTVTEFARIGARLLIGAVFFIAGVAKLANPREITQTLQDFGAPRRIRPFGVFLPLLELGIVAGLLFARTARFAAAAALALLLLFIAGIGLNLARGRQPACNCFGQFHSRPISWRTLVRNAVLAAGAWWLFASGSPPAQPDLWVFVVGLDSRGRRVAMVVAALIVFAVWRALWPDESDPDRIDESDAEEFWGDEPESAPPRRLRPEATVVATAQALPVPRVPTRILNDVGLAVGSEAPEFALPDIEGRQQDLASYRVRGLPVLLIFSSPFCQSCQTLMPKLPGLAAQHTDTLRLVVVSRGTVEQNLAKIKGPFTLPVLLQHDYEIAEMYDCQSTPAAVLISADGLIESLLAVGGAAIVQLIARSARPPVTPA